MSFSVSGSKHADWYDALQKEPELVWKAIQNRLSHGMNDVLESCDVSVWADNEHHAQIMVEQLSDTIEDWEDKEECVENNGHEFDERTPKLIDIREV
jgi:hypothetical protein